MRADFFCIEDEITMAVSILEYTVPSSELSAGYAVLTESRR